MARILITIKPRVSVQGVVSLGDHFATLCQEFDFYEVKKKYYYSCPSQLRYPQLSYFPSYAILNWVQKNSQLRYFPLFSPSYTIFFPPDALFLPFPVELLNSVAAQIGQEIYYKKTTPDLSYCHNYAILK